MINALVKAMKIMSLFSPTEPRLTLTEISRRTNMPKSTVHNLLNTLLSAGYIEKVDGDCYALGSAIIALTQNVRVNVELRDRAAPLLRMLADQCRESVYLTVRDGDAVLYIYAIESSQRLLARTAVGERVLMHCTSVGKAILAHLPTSESSVIVARAGLPAYTPTTIADVDSLNRELVQARQRGYSLDNQEHELNTFCVGAPIYDAQHHVIGACSVSGTDPEIVRTRTPVLAGAVKQTAQEISRRMGYVPAKTELVNPTAL